MDFGGRFEMTKQLQKVLNVSKKTHEKALKLKLRRREKSMDALINNAFLALKYVESLKDE